MSIRVYVAGPMSKGWLLDHVRAAIMAANQLRAAGFYPFLPQLMIHWDLVYQYSYESWMEYDFAWVSACQALLRLPGESSGADRECVHARSLSIPVFYSVEELVEHFAKAA